ncbi:response regulator transcription factor [Ideonella sp. A 288]|uniref:response regulator transcription factor n=1 Tax=Ideonella sp. A 288 TaxID=1962181 RepID=UPI000B4A6E54|nr:response regulator [Ideonella sp. A 288]
MSRLTIYLVEDSPVIRENLIGTLEELAPVEVVGMAEDEATAVAWMSQPGRQVDMLIVDIFLKGGSGLGVLREAARLLPNSTRLVLTNFATRDMRMKCLALGAFRVFDKSNEIDALIECCTELSRGASVSAPA